MDTQFIAFYILAIAIAICVLMVVCFSEISSEIDDLKKQKQKPKEANRTLEEIERDAGIVYCKECKLVAVCPHQNEKDERAGNPIKEVLGCNSGIQHTIIPAEED